MALNNAPGPGANNVPSYQMSGIPFVVTGTTVAVAPVEINFPYVTKDIYIRSRSSSLGISFTASGSSTSRMFTLEDNEVWQHDIRTTKLFLTGVFGLTGYEVVAGLTMIHRDDFPVLTASNGFSGVG